MCRSRASVVPKLGKRECVRDQFGRQGSTLEAPQSETKQRAVRIVVLEPDGRHGASQRGKDTSYASCKLARGRNRVAGEVRSASSLRGSRVIRLKDALICYGLGQALRNGVPEPPPYTGSSGTSEDDTHARILASSAWPSALLLP